MKKEIIAHLRGDIKDFHKEAAEDKALIKKLKSKKMSKHAKHEKRESKAEEKKEHSKKKSVKKVSSKKKHNSKVAKKAVDKFKNVMDEFKEGKLHSGSKMGKLVTKPKQAVAIAYSEDIRVRRKARRKK